jgi:two-component sensor histidine kinase
MHTQSSGTRSLRPHAWPLIAGVFALLFIAHGITLVTQTRKLQGRIDREMVLLDELGKLNQQIDDLALVHQVDLDQHTYAWPGELARVREQVRELAATHDDIAGMTSLEEKLAPHLHRSDSLHRESMMSISGSMDRRHVGTIISLMLQRGRRVVENTSRDIHEQGLALHTAQLNAGWDQAQWLLVAACLFAAVLAWLVIGTNRLLQRSKAHAAELARAQTELERSHRDLRETMLSKEEKEMMIKEIHHRVKNNLQIVKSLIRFQMDQVSDEKTTELFRECVNRVSAMALVHEQTYLSKDLANIDVNGYLQALIRDLVHAYAVGIRLNMDVDIQVKTLGVDTLVPLGLLINEVISNSLKHAFKGRTTGTIIVQIGGEEPDGLQIRIGDDGIGIPDRRNWDGSKTLGMDLIRTLAGQLDVRVELQNGPGTVYALTPIESGRVRKRA